MQIQLVPVNAPYFEDASLLVAADCAAYAYADFPCVGDELYERFKNEKTPQKG